jgi:hypothetical protein
MSIFFIGERRIPPVVDTPPTAEQKDAIVAGLAAKRDEPKISCSVCLKIELVRRYYEIARQIEPQLIAQIASDAVTTKPQATTFVAENTDGFPSAKFVNVMVEHCAPATFAGLVAACKAEVA